MAQERILVVDDEEKIRAIVKHFLKSAGYTVFCTGDPTEALELAIKERPDLAVLDISMPQKNGYELCEDIRKNEGTKDISVIFVSAMGKPDDRVKGLKAGAVMHIQKPFNKDWLLQAVRAALDAKQSAPGPATPDSKTP